MKLEKNKVFSYLVLLTFFTLISLTFWSEYLNFHIKNQEISKNELIINKANEDFEIGSINKIEEIEIFKTPDKKLLEKIVDIINNSKKYVYVEAYMLTENRIREAIIKAYYRWVDTKVILEKSPYLANNINKKTFEELEKKWINIVWSNQDNYSLNHSKIMLIDSLSIISTGNFSYSSFTQNRDLFIFTYDKNIHKNLMEIFDYDFKWEKNAVLYENLVLSPQNSRIKLNKLLDEAKDNIKIYIPYLKDEQLNNKLIELQKRWINIRILTDKTALDDESTKLLINSSINIDSIPKYKMHSKAILVDDKFLFLWSINFSNYSIDKNREIWILIKENEIINQFNSIFKEDMTKN